jgi:hypothetical protein
MGNDLRPGCGGIEQPDVPPNTAVLMAASGSRLPDPQGIVDSCEETERRHQNHACVAALLDDLALHLADLVHDGRLVVQCSEGMDEHESGDLQQIQHRPAGRAFH